MRRMVRRNMAIAAVVLAASTLAGCMVGPDYKPPDSTVPKQFSEATPGGTPFTLSRESDLYQVGFDSTWEVDVFGGVRRSIQAAEWAEQAAIEDRRDVLVSLLAEVARNYVELRGAQRQLAITYDNL